MDLKKKKSNNKKRLFFMKQVTATPMFVGNARR